MKISAQITASHLFSDYQSPAVQQTKTIGHSNVYINMQEQSFNYSYVSTELQSATVTSNAPEEYNQFQNFLQEIGYTGGPIASLSQEEATDLVSEQGFFGINQTAQRIADFVINGAGNDASLFQAGREGVLRGFKEAEAIFGGTLPEISYKTIEKAVETIDKAMHERGFSILSEEA